MQCIKDLDEGEEICFDLPQNSQGKKFNSRQKDQLKALNKVHSRLNKMNSRHNKENRSGKTNSANSLGAGLSHF